MPTRGLGNGLKSRAARVPPLPGWRVVGQPRAAVAGCALALGYHVSALQAGGSVGHGERASGVRGQAKRDTAFPQGDKRPRGPAGPPAAPAASLRLLSSANRAVSRFACPRTPEEGCPPGRIAAAELDLPGTWDRVYLSSNKGRWRSSIEESCFCPKNRPAVQKTARQEMHVIRATEQT